MFPNLSTTEALIKAVKSRDTETARNLLQQDPSLASTLTPDGSLLLTAIFYGAREIADLIRSLRSDVAANEAAAAGDTQRLAELITADPGLIETGSDGAPLIHMAAFFGHSEAVALLLDHGAEIDRFSGSTAPNIPSTAALHAALAGRQWETAELLMDRGADQQVADSAGLTPLHHAAFGGHLPMVQRLLASGVAVNQRANNGETPLAQAVRRDNEEVAALLRQHGGED